MKKRIAFCKVFLVLFLCLICVLASVKQSFAVSNDFGNNFTEAEVEYGFRNGVFKSYDGQAPDAYGYGGIADPVKYLKDRYGAKTVTLIEGPYVISVQNRSQSILNNSLPDDLKDKGTCSLIAIAMFMDYFRAHRGYTNIESNIYILYEYIVRNSSLLFGGANPLKINNYITNCFNHYGYTNIYGHTDNTDKINKIKSEINAGRPVIMSLSKGYYGDHTIVIRGYSIYKVTKKGFLGIGTTTTNYLMLNVADGWGTTTTVYLDVAGLDWDAAGSFGLIWNMVRAIEN